MAMIFQLYYLFDSFQGYITPGKSDSPMTGEPNQAQLMSPMAFSVQPPARRDLGKSIGANQNIPVAINPPQHVNITGMIYYSS